MILLYDTITSISREKKLKNIFVLKKTIVKHLRKITKAAASDEETKRPTRLMLRRLSAYQRDAMLVEHSNLNPLAPR